MAKKLLWNGSDEVVTKYAINDSHGSAINIADLNTRIGNLQNIGRFLSLWDASTGVATSNPPTSPYAYKTGDYFRIATGGNRIPTGSSYTTGGTNYTTSVATLGIGDVVYYDGTVWQLQSGTGNGTVVDVQANGTSVVAAGIANVTASSLGVSFVDMVAPSSTTLTTDEFNEITNGKGHNLIGTLGYYAGVMLYPARPTTTGYRGVAVWNGNRMGIYTIKNSDKVITLTEEFATLSTDQTFTGSKIFETINSSTTGYTSGDTAIAAFTMYHGNSELYLRSETAALGPSGEATDSRAYFATYCVDIKNNKTGAEFFVTVGQGTSTQALNFHIRYRDPSWSSSHRYKFPEENGTLGLAMYQHEITLGSYITYDNSTYIYSIKFVIITTSSAQLSFSELKSYVKAKSCTFGGAGYAFSSGKGNMRYILPLTYSLNKVPSETDIVSSVDIDNGILGVNENDDLFYKSGELSREYYYGAGYHSTEKVAFKIAGFLSDFPNATPCNIKSDTSSVQVDRSTFILYISDYQVKPF